MEKLVIDRKSDAKKTVLASLERDPDAKKTCISIIRQSNNLINDIVLQDIIFLRSRFCSKKNW